MSQIVIGTICTVGCTISTVYSVGDPQPLGTCGVLYSTSNKCIEIF